MDISKEDYKLAKEAHVSNCTGGSIHEINLVCASLVVNQSFARVHITDTDTQSVPTELPYAMDVARSSKHHSPRHLYTGIHHLCITCTQLFDNSVRLRILCLNWYGNSSVIHLLVKKNSSSRCRHRQQRDRAQVLPDCVSSWHNDPDMYCYFGSRFPVLSSSICQGRDIWNIAGNLPSYNRTPFLDADFTLDGCGRWFLCVFIRCRCI